MECPYCGGDSRVLDSRPSGDDIRRRRECQECRRRFTTYERVAPPEIKVTKRGGQPEDFDRAKILRIVRRVTRDRGVADATVVGLVRGLEAELVDAGIQTIPSWRLAEKVTERLVEVDPLAADRFAADYRQDDGTLRFHEDDDTPQMPLPGIPPSPPPENDPPPPRRPGRPRSRKPR